MSVSGGLFMGRGSSRRLGAVASLLLGCTAIVNSWTHPSAHADAVPLADPEDVIIDSDAVAYSVGVRQGEDEPEFLLAALSKGTLQSTTKVIALSIDTKAILELVERQKKPSVDERFQKYYLESRGFQDPKIVVELLHEDDRERSILTFPLSESTEPTLLIEPARPIRSIRVDLTGQREQWACFDPATCALQGNVPGVVPAVFEGDSDSALLNGDILQCGRGHNLSYQLSDVQNQNVWIPLSMDDQNSGAPSNLRGRGPSPASCQDSFGFSGELTWTNLNASSEVISTHTYGRFTVRLEGDRVAGDYEILPHKLCEFERLSYDGRSYPVVHRVDINQSCTKSPTPGGHNSFRLLREQVFAEKQIFTRVTEPCVCALGE
jgi:hypothetical protein